MEIRRGRKINAERNFFPGYVLVKMDMTDETYHLVKNNPKVTGFLARAPSRCRSPSARWRGSSAPSKRASTAETDHQLRDRRDRTGHRRPVRQLQRLGGAGRRGARAPAGHRLHLRPRHPGRAGIRPGREGQLAAASFPLAGEGGAKATDEGSTGAGDKRLPGKSTASVRPLIRRAPPATFSRSARGPRSRLRRRAAGAETGHRDRGVGPGCCEGEALADEGGFHRLAARLQAIEQAPQRPEIVRLTCARGSLPPSPRSSR